MNQRNLIIGIITVLIVGVAVGFLLMKNQILPQQEQAVFASQEECEQRTGQLCSFQMCDYIPSEKTLEEVCGKNFKKGWVASQP
ncbi:MAG TPA: hypothetical protein VJB60_02120 [Candidatus Peribacterales bacterium]|nr:hypothetical protein [Candidatus Peribacterales bacterium]